MNRRLLQHKVRVCTSQAQASRQHLLQCIAPSGYRLLQRISLWAFVTIGFVQGFRHSVQTVNIAARQPPHRLSMLVSTLSWLMSQLVPIYIAKPEALST